VKTRVETKVKTTVKTMAKLMKNIPTEWKRELLRTVCHRTAQWVPHKEPRESFYYIDVSSVSNVTF